jgi:hypothetical protein
MLLRVSEQIKDCLDHAAESRQRANKATDPERKAELLDMERRWLRLAESHGLVEQLERFITDAKRRREKP